MKKRAKRIAALASETETLIVAGLALVLVAGGVYYYLSSAVQQQERAPVVTEAAPAEVAVPFTELARGSKSTVKTRVNYLIRTPEDLKKLWKMVDATSTPPKVDFTRETVIAVFAGKAPTAGYAISVSQITDAEERMVSITVAKPDRTCMTANVLTMPYEVVKVPTTSLPLTHEDVTVAKSCP